MLTEHTTFRSVLVPHLPALALTAPPPLSHPPTLCCWCALQALCWCSHPLTQADVDKLEAVKGLEVAQDTPVRVLHRRAPKVCASASLGSGKKGTLGALVWGHLLSSPDH